MRAMGFAVLLAILSTCSPAAPESYHVNSYIPDTDRHSYTSSVYADKISASKGMTWSVVPDDRAGSKNLTFVSCKNGSGPQSCNAYEGDMTCSAKLPVLCINPLQLMQPGSLSIQNQYEEWSGAQVALSYPVQGSNMTSRQEADNICSEKFGTGWRMAEFHDGWGWGFWARGHINTEQRFWVAIDDQPANCWNHGIKKAAEPDIETWSLNRHTSQ